MLGAVVLLLSLSPRAVARGHRLSSAPPPARFDDTGAGYAPGACALTSPPYAAEAEGCTRCDLYRVATQTVFGEGDPAARLVLIGEQPGDREDVEGRPFVGPAGQLLDRALAAAGIDAAQCT